MASKHAWKVELLPWDHLDPDHVERLYVQRVACGWREEEVPQYVESAKQGGKIFYWVVLSDNLPDRDAVLQRHSERYPTEATPLRDSAQLIRGVPRDPTGAQFWPVGHIALDIHTPEEDAKHGLPGEGVVWMHQLYISYALHAGGYGSAAVAKGEEIAAQGPMKGKIMVLDTMASRTQSNPDFLHAMFTSKGNPLPKITNEQWYTRLGYKTFGKELLVPQWEARPGVYVDIDIVFMSKPIGHLGA
ncbi:uncharacterized protein B0I36DRAFT_323423 [Microdochium trichocladiopsis]|uniref:Uncharacterized protein n=1 Tax=Microdochium trichocladiopsis TaxID=1682393 RepID=A0A9P8Y6T4_9PEZI|nr:uncharacterized protein B0I36DRAFT_323423 [Microdochium trichocladiopsis]KAH7031210.1 hypothetical protein B0I36DRAFT_323423 [Microdochium trichocladiopsis]